MSFPVSDDVAACFARFYFGGKGPSHQKLTQAFKGSGYGDDDPYVSSEGVPNKETRVRAVVAAAVRRPANSSKLIERLLIDLRISGQFSGLVDAQAEVANAQRALARIGWTLSDEGYLSPMGAINLSTGGRPALEEQIGRLRRSTSDPAILLGSAKDLLEATAKFVLEEVGMPQSNSADFNQLWYMARERLGVLPTNITADTPGAKHIKSILGGAWMIAEKVNDLRNLQGVGHGRTLPTGVTTEVALLVVRQACLVAEFMLTTLDRQYGRP